MSISRAAAARNRSSERFQTGLRRDVRLMMMMRGNSLIRLRPSLRVLSVHLPGLLSVVGKRRLLAG